MKGLPFPAAVPSEGNKESVKRKADLILILGLIAAGVILGLILLFTRHSGKTVQVRISGEVVKNFSLDQDTEYLITGKGGGTNLLKIQGGKAWVEEADCPDGLCKNMGKISMSGQSVVCLPHEVVVEIVDKNGNEEGAPDIIIGN